MITNVQDGNGLLMAIIVRGSALATSSVKEGATFVTQPEHPLQVGVINHRQGKVIRPHHHPIYSRTVRSTAEVLILLKGILKVDLYGNDLEVQTYTLLEGDTILLLAGGHGFEALSDIEMIEVKQGPFFGTKVDKVAL